MDLAASEALPVLAFAASSGITAQAKCQIKAHAVNHMQNLNLNGLRCTRLITRLKVSRVHSNGLFHI